MRSIAAPVPDERLTRPPLAMPDLPEAIVTVLWAVTPAIGYRKERRDILVGDPEGIGAYLAIPQGTDDVPGAVRLHPGHSHHRVGRLGRQHSGTAGLHRRVDHRGRGLLLPRGVRAHLLAGGAHLTGGRHSRRRRPERRRRYRSGHASRGASGPVGGDRRNRVVPAGRRRTSSAATQHRARHGLERDLLPGLADDGHRGRVRARRRAARQRSVPGGLGPQHSRRREHRADLACTGCSRRGPDLVGPHRARRRDDRRRGAHRDSVHRRGRRHRIRPQGHLPNRAPPLPGRPSDA